MNKLFVNAALFASGGKSAILTGIVIGLGGRATNTSRGQTVKTFIKKGTPQANIRVKLRNYNGNERQSYKFKSYGKFIIVERIIRNSGSTSYALKDEHGKVVSTKKSDLDEIVKYFSMQIDNPVCILNQEVSRNFLNSKNPKLKYDFFMQATQLQRLQEEYIISKDKHTEAREISVQKASTVPEIEQEEKALKKKVNLFSECSSIRDRLKSLKIEAHWKDAIDREASLKEVEKKVDETRTMISNGECRLEEQIELIQESDAERVKVHEEVTGLIEKYGNIRANINAIKQEANVLKVDRRAQHVKMKMQETLIKEIQSDIDQLQDGIRQKQRQNE